MNTEVVFSSDDLDNITYCLIERMRSLEYVYRRNVNDNAGYADYVASLIAKYEDIYHRVTGFYFITSSDSLERYLHGHRANLELVTITSGVVK